MKVIGYVRVSTDKQADEGVSLEAQHAKIVSWADLNGYELGPVFVDAGISGKATRNRPGLQDALNAIEKGDALVTYSLSRLSRSTVDTIRLADQLEKKGADLVSISERIDTTNAAGKMVFRMLAVLNEFERDLVSERTKSALQFKKAQGQKTGGDVPFGYSVDDIGHLYPNPDEQETIELITRLKAKGFSLRGICQELERKNIRTRNGGLRWYPTTVNRILKAA